MRLIIAFVNIMLAGFMALFAVSALNMYFFGNEKSYEQYLLLESDGIETSFKADTAFIPATMKATDEEAFALKYTFQVKDQEYRGIYYTQDTTAFNFSDLSGKYLPDNPSVNAVDIDARLKEFEAKLESTDDLKYGGISLLLSIVLGFLGIRSAKLHKRKKNES
jgi:hypothetical protein